MRMPLCDVVSQFPEFEGNRAASGHRAVEVNPVTHSGYVWPDVEGDAASLSVAPIVLVNAPGAMGKTEAARNVANTLRAVYIDLAKLNVGSGTLVGELFKALGATNLEAFQNDVRLGKAALVLDSTDEAQLRAGAQNFYEFLQDLELFIDDDVAGPRVILLGRSDSVAMTSIGLELIGRSAPVIELAPLSHSQACELLDYRLDAIGSKMHREQPEPAGRLRDHVLSDLGGALSGGEVFDLLHDWARVESFLGYPPVLIALAQRLKSSNPQSDLADAVRATSLQSHRRSGELLREVVEYILDRESGKVRDALGQSLAMAADDPNLSALYGRDEQAARVLDLTGTLSVNLDRPAVLDDEDRERYEKLLEDFVPDHPFLRDNMFASPVFSDYLRAWAVSSPLAGLWSDRPADFYATLPAVGPFFARFLAALSEGAARLPEDLVQDAVRSHALGSARAYAQYLHKADGTPTLELVEDAADLADGDLRFEIVDAAGVLTLVSPINRLSVFTDHGVVLVAGLNGQLDLGPTVLVIAEDLEIEANTVRVVSTGSAVDATLLGSPNPARHSQELQVVTYRDQDLLVAWPEQWHQWNKYVLPADAVGRPIGRTLSMQVVVAVRKLLTSFRSNMNADPAVSSDKVDRILVGGNEVAGSVRDALLELEVITQVGTVYQLALTRLGELGVAWHQVTASDPYTSLSKFCERVINTKAFSDRHLRGGGPAA